MAATPLYIAPTTVNPPTSAQLAAQAVTGIASSSLKGWLAQKQLLQQQWKQFWQASNGATPAAIAAAMGTGGYAAFRNFGTAVASLIATAPALPAVGNPDPNYVAPINSGTTTGNVLSAGTGNGTTDLGIPAGVTVTFTLDGTNNPTGAAVIAAV